MTGFNSALFSAYPQLISIDVLGHALQATKHAIATVHPELGAGFEDCEEVGDITHRALCIVSLINDLQGELAAYCMAAEAEMNETLEIAQF